MGRDDDVLKQQAARAGRAIGAMFFSAFGGAWLLLWAYSEFGLAVGVLAVPGLVTLGLLTWAYKVYRTHAAAMRELEHSPVARRRGRIFNAINAAQWVLIFVAATLLSTFGHGDLVLPTIIGIIGLHFLPLAWLFAYRPHLLTGVALLALACVYPSVAEGGGQSSVGALGAGLILWTSAVWAIRPRNLVRP